MHGRHPLGQVGDDPDDPRRVHRAVAADLAQVPAGDVLDDQVELPVDPLDPVAAGDERAGHLRQGPALLGLARVAVVALQDDVALQVGVEREVGGRLAARDVEPADVPILADGGGAVSGRLAAPVVLGRLGRGRRGRLAFEEPLRAGPAELLQQAEHLRPQAGIGGALALHERRPLRARQLVGAVDQVAEPAVSVVLFGRRDVHGVSVGLSRSRSHARAKLQSRSTVFCDNPERFRDIRRRHPQKKPEMHDHAGASIQAAERLQLVAEIDRVDLVNVGEPVDRGVERVLPPPSPALLGRMPAMVIDEQLVHGLARGHQQEGAVVGILQGPVAAEAEEGLVHQLGRLPGVIGPLPPHPTRGECPQVLVQQGDEEALGLAVARPHPAEETARRRDPVPSPRLGTGGERGRGEGDLGSLIETLHRTGGKASRVGRRPKAAPESLFRKPKRAVREVGQAFQPDSDRTGPGPTTAGVRLESLTYAGPTWISSLREQTLNYQERPPMSSSMRHRKRGLTRPG